MYGDIALICMLVLLCPFVLSAAETEQVKSRLIVIADLGNEPDEMQQMTHLLIYANRVDIEGLIACSGKYLHPDRKDGGTKTHPELFHKLVNAYAKVVENLKQHEDGWPTATDPFPSGVSEGRCSTNSRRGWIGASIRRKMPTTIRSLRSETILATASSD